MTIVVGVATPEGIVLASDSRTTTVDDHDRHRIASDSAQKVFRLGNMAAATFGAAFVGFETIAGLMDQFEAQHAASCERDFEVFNQELGGFFTTKFMEANPNWDTQTQGFPLGFVTAGYGADGIGHARLMGIPGPEIVEQQHKTTRTRGSLWQGQNDVIGRLWNGLDRGRFARAGVTPSPEVGAALAELAYIDPGVLTIQDGVDFAAFVIRTTIDMQRFTDGTQANPKGVPGCGGPIQILAVERSGPRWVAELQLGPSQPGSAEGALGVGGAPAGG